nr:nitrilase-related carbon-nitrogen hydrolase [Micromonospora sp. DSM 115978]
MSAVDMPMAMQLVAGVGVALLSGVLFRRGNGLRPVPLATWLAPLPLLAFAPRSSWQAAVAAAAVAWLVGQLGLWTYFTKDLRVPRLLAAAHMVGGASLVAVVVGLTRVHLVGGRPVAAALTLPVAWAAMEFLVSLRSPHGAWWSIAYSQADRPAVVGVAALTGVWGVSALVVTPAAMVAAVTAPVGTVGERLAALFAGLVLPLVAYGYGRRRRASAGDPVRVGLAVVPQAGLPVPIESAEGAELLAGYVALVRRLAGRGVQVVVLPEAVFIVAESGFTDQLRPLGEVAAELGVPVVVGVIRDGSTNVAAVLRGDGNPPEVYAKRHLVPGLEAAYRPGRDPLYVSVGATRAGVAVCKDLDFAALVRSYRRGGARLLLAPAWDFEGDDWLHSRMAVLRGVESGIPVARAARGGRATVSDGSGRIVAEASTVPVDAGAGVAIDAAVKPATGYPGYARFGDWFAWACLVATILLVVASLHYAGARP